VRTRPGRDAVQVGLHHGTGVERRDLVVVPIGHDHRLGGVYILHAADKAGVDAELLQSRQVFAAISAQHGHGQRVASQQLEAVCDIASASSKVAAQCGNEKRHIQDMQLLGQYLLCKTPIERHDGVEGQGTANQRSHRVKAQE